MAARDWVEKDFYKVLGVAEKATKDEIKRAYRKLAQKFHPDTNKNDPEAEKRFKEVSEAHAVLSNADKRKEYDEIRRYASSGGGPFGFRPGAGNGRERVQVNVEDLIGGAGGGDLFGDLFGFRGGHRRGQDVETEAYLTFEDAVQGSTVELADGTKVKVPAGVKDDSRIRVAGKGGPGPQGAPAGDLFVQIHVHQHPIFKQGERGDLVVTLPVTFTEAALGANVQVPTMDGAVTLKVPPGTRSGKILRVKGRGGLHKGKPGDLLAMVEVQVPSKLSKKERDLLEQFAQLHDEDPRSHFARFVKRNEQVS